MGPIGCPEASVTSYQFALREIPLERRYHLHRSGSLKCRVLIYCSYNSTMPVTLSQHPEARKREKNRIVRQKNICFYKVPMHSLLALFIRAVMEMKL